MAVNYDSWYDMTLAVSVMKPFSTYFVDTFFSKSITSPNNIVMFEKKKEADGIARFVTKYDNGKIVNKLSIDTAGFQIPTTRERMVFSIEEFNHFKTLGTKILNLSSDSGNTTKISEFSKWVLENLKTLKIRVIRRQEQMAVEAMTTGKIVIVDGTDTFKIDYGIPTSNIVTHSTAAKWTADTSDPIEDIIEYSRLVSKNTGINCDRVIMGSDAAKAYRNNTKVIEKLNTLNYQVGTLQPTNSANIPQVGAQKFGALPGGFELYEYNQQYTNHAGTTVPMFLPNTVLITSSQLSSLGCTERAKGTLSRFKEDANTIDQSVEFLADKRVNEDRTAVTYTLSHMSLPVIKVPEAMVIAKVV